MKKCGIVRILQNNSALDWFKIRLAWIIRSHPRITILLLNMIYLAVILPQSSLDWPGFGDMISYARMAEGLFVEIPFSYRIIVPWIVSFFPVFFHKWVFLGITIISLVLTSILLFDYIKLKGLSLELSYFGVVIFMGSNIFQYHLIGFGLVDPVYLCLVIATLLLLERKEPLWAIPLLVLGFFVKESFIFIVPVVVVDSIINRNWIATFFSLVTGTVLGIITISRSVSYTFETVLENMTYNGINLSNSLPQIALQTIQVLILRATWVYGIILFSAVVGFIFLSRKDKLMLVILLAGTAVTIMFATDWNRMMFFPFPVIILIGLLPFQDMARNTNMQGIMKPTSIVAAGLWFVLGPARWLFSIDGVLYVYLLLGLFFGLFALIINFERLRKLIPRHETPIIDGRVKQIVIS